MATRIGIALLLAGGIVAALLWSQRETGPLLVSGFLEADQIRVGSRVGGRILAVHVDEGDEVAEGQLLVELEPFDLEALRAEAEAEVARARAELARLEAGFRREEIAQAAARRERLAARLREAEEGPRAQEIEAARARLRQGEASLDLAQAEFERTTALFERSSVSQDEVDRATRSRKAAAESRNALAAELALLEEGTRKEVIEQARAELAEAEAALELLRNGYRPEETMEARAAVAAAEASAEALRTRIAELRIVAPVAGTIEAMKLRKGDLVGQNAPVLSLLDARRLWVRAYVPESRVSFPLGAAVKVRVDAQPGRTFRGEVTFIAREAEFTPGNVQTPEERSKQVFRIKVDLREGLDLLRPGMPADVVFE
jgi:multidrug resistance efflux pump